MMKMFAGLIMVIFLGSSPNTNTRIVDDSITVRWSSAVMHRIHVLSQGMHNEVLLCGLGHQANDTLSVTDVRMPDQVSDTIHVSSLESCPNKTVMMWHLHPWAGPRPEYGLTTPADFCALSTMDMIATMLNSKVNFTSVSVGYDGKTYLCWWNRSQVIAALDSNKEILESVPDQRMIYWQE